MSTNFKPVMKDHKHGPRAEYRQVEIQRVKDSATLAQAFGDLKSLTVDMAYFDQEGHTKSGNIKYTVNLAHSKSLFRFDCPNNECVGGDFDLSTELANAVANRNTASEGELTCRGWRSKTTIGELSCLNVLRYKFSLGYE